MKLIRSIIPCAKVVIAVFIHLQVVKIRETKKVKNITDKKCLSC